MASEGLPASIQVMLVDDQPIVLLGMRLLVDKQKPRMEVGAVASNAADAIEKARCLQPDVIVLGIGSGGGNALDILSSLLECSRAKVLIFTGTRDEAMLDAAILRGARGVVRKVEPTDIVLRAIEKVHAGELWLDREATGRIFNTMRTGRKVAKKTDKLSLLTPQERKAVNAIVCHLGAPNKLLAKHLLMSEHTLRNHLSSIYQKLEVENRLGLYIYATRQGSDVGETAADRSHRKVGSEAEPLCGTPSPGQSGAMP